MTDTIKGICTTHPHPDWWFPEFDNGRPSNAKIASLTSTITAAVNMCNSCPVQDKCLEMGMEENDLPHGIWGGKLAGQRIAMLGKTKDDYGLQTDEGRALVFYERIRPHLE